MDDLLFLTHRIPYPPNKGDKIRSYHLLKHLSQRYRVHLGTFIDDPDDWRHVDHVKNLCGKTHFARIKPNSARLRCLDGLITNQPLTLGYYRNAGLQAWVEQVLNELPIKCVMVFSSAVAQYVSQAGHVRRVIDFVDIDSDKWLQYSEGKTWPMSWLYRREGRLLLHYERQVARDFDASLFVSHAEADLFRQIAPESAEKIGFFNNGVDTEYFSPAHNYQNPYPADTLPLVFTGAMDYWPNADAVQWFAREILPAVLTQNPGACFYIVGSRPTAAVRALAELPGVVVTGMVPDIRPYLAHARLAVAPLRIARGIQNKVLEAMAMAKPVIASIQALEGITANAGEEVLLARDSGEFIATVSALLKRPLEAVGKAARVRVQVNYSWELNLKHVDQLLSPHAAARSTATASPLVTYSTNGISA
ncbi:MAG: TIGR03087 family PEP-CTERM/XrtA system glycosyltransferase [Gallionella sp.]